MDGIEHVLIVEDQPSLQAAVRLTLEAEGYSVLTASNGMQALQVMEETTPAIVVADIMMPQMDGYDFFRAVRARSEWVSIPFIFLTAMAEREERIKGKALGAEDYLTKPVDPVELVTAVHSRLARTRAIRENAEKSLDELKQQIVTMLSHELRTPLTYIRGYTDLALDDVPSLPPELLEEFLRAISQGADRLTRLADDFLTLIRLDTNQAQEEFRQLAQVHRDLGEIVVRTISQHEPKAAARGLALKFRVEPNLPPVRLCEPLFVDALGRLLDNAIKFSQEKSEEVVVSSRETPEWVEIAVTDEGVGIPPGEIPHAFERFRQIDRERMEQQGAGLGLPIAQEIVRLHGGEIEVTSVVREGSTFTIKLPLAEM
jgi:two-component system sensor histidine kinase/response regulator